jgi:phage terminase large subunit
VYRVPQTVRLNYEAREQFVPFHLREQRWAALVAHRRAGKTVGSLADLIDDTLRCPLENPRGAYIAPTYTQAKDVAWEYVKKITAPIPGVLFHESELRVDIPGGARIRLYGADNYDRMRGLYFDVVVLDEYADMDPKAWSEVIRPALSDRKGKATFIGTPKGVNAFAEVCANAKDDPEWFFAELKASQTGILDAAELRDARGQMTREQYAQEYECSFEASVVGAYYADELEAAKDRILSGLYDPATSVRTYWDLGLDDATSVWFAQVVNREIRLIDYQEWTGQALTAVAKDVLAKPYAYDRHVMPHDIEVREMTTAVSRRSVIEGLLGANKLEVVKAQEVADGINATRVLFNRMWFDKDKCARGLECLRNYRKQWDEKRKTFQDKPYHDWASHGADALRMLGLSFRDELKAFGPLKRHLKGIV